MSGFKYKFALCGNTTVYKEIGEYPILKDYIEKRTENEFIAYATYDSYFPNHKDGIRNEWKLYIATILINVTQDFDPFSNEDITFVRYNTDSYRIMAKQLYRDKNGVYFKLDSKKQYLFDNQNKELTNFIKKCRKEYENDDKIGKFVGYDYDKFVDNFNKEFDRPFRVTKIDGQPCVVTCDYRPERLNLHVEDKKIVDITFG